MNRIQKYLVAAFLGFWPMIVIGQEADFEVRNFHERTTDLSAISSNYKDLNGVPAALIRFTVRDSQFEFDANLGIIAQKRKTGEVYLYVPQDTRRLTIRHPRLGVLKDYVIPAKIRSKVTYDADIVITGSSQPMVGNHGDWSHDWDTAQDQGPAPVIFGEAPHPTTHPSSFEPDFHFYAGVGFNAVSLMGPSIHLGFRYNMFCLEGGFAYGMDKVENVTFSLKGSSSPTEAYDYSCSKVWARLGVNFEVTESIRIAPMAGVTFNMISGKSTLSSTSTDYFKESNPMSILAAVRFSYEVVEHLHLHLTPQYDFNLNGDQIFTVIKEADSKIKSWGEGFGVNVGVIYEF